VRPCICANDGHIHFGLLANEIDYWLQGVKMDQSESDLTTSSSAAAADAAAAAEEDSTAGR